MEDKSRRASLGRAGILIYRQVAGLLGGLSMLVLLHHVFDVGVTGILGEVVVYWDQYVRPVAKWILDILIVMPLRLIGLRVDLPVDYRDWLTVGMVLCVSYYRAFWNDDELRDERRILHVFWVFIFVHGGPIMFFVLPFAAMISFVGGDKERIKATYLRVLVALTPVAYLGLLSA